MQLQAYSIYSSESAYSPTQPLYYTELLCHYMFMSTIISVQIQEQFHLYTEIPFVNPLCLIRQICIKHSGVLKNLKYSIFISRQTMVWHLQLGTVPRVVEMVVQLDYVAYLVPSFYVWPTFRPPWPNLCLHYLLV